MIKIRVMGTVEEIRLFQEIIKGCPDIELGMPSGIYGMRGTDRFFRNYMEAELNKRLLDKQQRNTDRN